MKKTLLFLTLFLAIIIHSFSQNRFIARGAEPGELYLTGSWYGIYNPVWGPPYYDTLRTALYRLTENGKKLTIQYDADYFANPEFVMQPQVILADATPGVLYSRNTYSKNYFSHTSLWVSFDYGENWIFKEENIGSKDYFSANIEGLIYRAASTGTHIGTYNSYDYANTFNLINNQKISAHETGFEECEFLSIIGRGFYHTFDCFQNYVNLTIGEEFAFSQMGGLFPDIYRGGFPNEVYISSWFPDWSYKVSFSADTGRTFRHVYVCENCSPYTSENVMTSFMSDREPGVFYIIRRYEVEDTNPWGWHVKVCVDYYKDYGEILEATFCHDLIKNYEYEEVICNNTTYLESNINLNSIQLQWTTSANNELIRGYHIYRNNTRITNELLTGTIYLDENLPIGEYKYFVKTYYKEGCVSDRSNLITENVEVGVKEIEDINGIVLYPNPTTGKLQIEIAGQTRNDAIEIEIFDVYGRNVLSNHLVIPSSHHVINISELHTGVYFVRIITEKGAITKKIIKH